ncbi:MAG: phosphotransferase family protein [Cellulomonas sp.]|nr:phosphotransferase family protein [Cellulomonas sp.]
MSPSLDLDRLTPYLDSVVVGGLAGPLTADLVAGGRSNPTYALGDGEQQWILRRPPYGEYVASGHDMGREARVMSALGGSSVPVPAVLVHCEDTAVIGAPFYVMDRLDGVTYRTPADTVRLSEHDRAGISHAMLDTLVDLHAIEPAAVGLGGWGRPDGYLERQVARWGRQWSAVATSERSEPAILLDRLTRSLPTMRFPGIVHGDFKIDNIMVAPDDATKILGVLDWEMATTGDTLADLGILVSFWDEPGRFFNPVTQGATAQPGFPSVREMVEGYVTRRGIALDDLDWYIVFADFKIAVILEQIHSRHLQGTTVGDGFDDIGDMVGPLLERALERAGAATDPILKGV